MLFSSLFAKTAEYEKLAHALSAPGACALFGLPGSGRAMVYAALAKETGRFLCIVTPGEAEATRFAGDLNALGIPTAVFPARDYVLRPIESTAREYEYRRLSVLGDIVGGRLQAVCVPDEGLTQYTTPRAEFCNNTRPLHPGDTVPRTELTALLYNAGYARRAQVDGPGQFSIRGDIVDLYAPDMKLPVRMEFWGDEIDTMHTFDLATQRREDPIEKIYVSPAREVLFGSPAEAAELLRAFIKKFRGKKRTALEACLATELAQLDGGALPVNMDKYLAVRYPQPATLLDYFDDPLLVLEGFIDKRLTEFLRSELRMPFLAERVEKWMDSHGATEEILYLILKECNYYTPKEQAAYRQTVNGLKKLSEEEYEKRRADYFYGLDLFGKAVTIYEQTLDGAGRHLSGDFRGKVWNNIAACYAKLFCYQKAMHAYENAWNAKPEAEYVKRMYFLTILNPELSLKDKFREMIGEDDKEVWNKEVEEAREESEKAPETLKLAAVFEKDPAGRIAAAGDVLNRWKMEYRRML